MLLGFINRGYLFLPHASDFSLAFASVLIKIFLILLFLALVLGGKRLVFRNNTFLSHLYFYQFVIGSILIFISPPPISPYIHTTYLSSFLEFPSGLPVLVSFPFIFLFLYLK